MISSWFGCFFELGRERESTPFIVLYKTRLSRTPGGFLEVIGCVASKTMEDFTALLEMHPLTHMTLGRERESTPYPPMILYARRMVRRGQSYAVDSKRSIDLKTQVVAHVLIRYPVLARPSFINK